MKKGFTLIELLVVIAIIAILAAILFPVFAQAKVAAKGAASLSNSKQLTLAHLMYAGDHDDVAVPDETWGNPVAPVWYGVEGTEFEAWGWLILPYIKSGELFLDPLTSAPTVYTSLGFSNEVSYSYEGLWGYNYTVWSPVYNVDVEPWPRSPRSFTSVGEPAGTVLMAGKTNPDVWFGVWYGERTKSSSGSVEPPDCNNAPSVCFFNWGYYDFLTDTYGFTSEVEGSRTGTVALRKSGSAIVAFGDGHVASMKPGSLAAGTNWNRDLPGDDLVVTDVSKYLWDEK